jgi:hypothetical protein
MTPLVLAIWILMAGSARLLSVLFGGKVTFEQYLNLFGFSFFAFWITSSALDVIYSGVFRRFVLQALRMEHGAAIRTIVVWFPATMWTTLLALGGMYNALVAHECEQFSVIKSALVGMATAIWPIVLVSILLR